VWGEFGVSHEDVEVQAVLRLLLGGVITVAKSPDPDGVVEWEVGDTVVRAEIYVVHSGGDLLWQTEVRNTGSMIRTPAQAHSAQEVADRDLAEGESDQVEFKPFLIEGDESGKAGECIRTIVAFSNSAGGRLYLGVQDDSVPEGRGRYLKSAGTDPDKAEEAHRKRMTKMISDKIKPVPKNVSMDVVEVAGSPIFAVTVRPGADGPYSTHENDIFVRKGGTNRRPDPRSELPGLYPRKTGHDAPLPIGDSDHGDLF
jgi:hypothetical protein